MATLPSSTAKTLTLDSSSLFLSSVSSHARDSPQTPIPQSFSLLSQNSPLPPIPSDFPQTKLIPNTRFIVDGFKFARDFSVSYFLSHFHSDHYTGLTPTWSKGIIFCSELTAKLLIETLKISPLFVVSLKLNVTVEVDRCEVTAVDANHCPGAVQFLFKVQGSDGQRSERYIHTGDFRFSDSMKKDPFLCQFVGSDAVFLDTTYCNPKFAFPSQEESINYIVSTIEKVRNQNEGSEEPVLVLIATYVIGKERILLEISRRLDCLLHVDIRKLEILSVLGFGDVNVFTEDASASGIHVIGWNVLGETWPYFRPNFTKMKELTLERGYSKAVGFVSTGWMYETKKEGFSVRAKDEFEIHLVPYSEHSSYEELREYVRFLRPKRVIPTVGLDVEEVDGKNAMSLQKHFQGLIDETANKQEFLMAFSKKTANVDLLAGSDTTLIPAHTTESFSENLDSEDIEKAKGELRDYLPSWVTEDQILSLLRGCNGDIVGAVSEFFEHEIEFYEKANACVSPVTDPGSKTNARNDFPPFPAIDSSQGHHESGIKFEKLGKKPISTDSIPKSNLPRKRGPNVGNKQRKKAKSSTTGTGGSKQSTITKFFGRPLSSSSHDDEPKVIGAPGTNVGMPLIVDAPGTYKKEVDQFLQIIQNGIARNAAVSLINKVKGDVGLAVHMYFSISSNVFGDEEASMPNSTKAEMCVGLVNSYSETTCSSQETKNLSSLFIHGTSSDYTNVTSVSLPIEKYSPVEHGLYCLFIIGVLWKEVVQSVS